MPQNLYCWRCQIIVPMLDEKEYSALSAALAETKQDLLVQNSRERHAIRQWRVMQVYKSITGIEANNFNALFHQRIAKYGPPCEQCGKPLRTPKAAFCAACGTDRK